MNENIVFFCNGSLSWECDKMDNCKWIVKSKVNLIDENPIRVSVLRTYKRKGKIKETKSKT